MAIHITPHSDVALAESLERGQGWMRVGGEVARRFALHGAHFAARDDAGALLGGVSVVLHTDAGAGPLAWVSGMVVVDAARRRGVGRQLMGAALAWAEKEGAASVGLDASAAGVPLYDSLGFATLARAPRWERAEGVARPSAIPKCESSAVYPISSCEIMELHAYDAPRFGAGRSAWLATIINEFPGRAFVAFDKKNGHVTGFALGTERYVGPLVADAPDIAARLLYACERAGTPTRAVLLDANPDAARVFEDAGYAPEGVVCTRMVRRGDDAVAGGSAALPGRPETIYAIGAWALG